MVVRTGWHTHTELLLFAIDHFLIICLNEPSPVPQANAPLRVSALTSNETSPFSLAAATTTIYQWDQVLPLSQNSDVYWVIEYSNDLQHDIHVWRFALAVLARLVSAFTQDPFAPRRLAIVQEGPANRWSNPMASWHDGPWTWRHPAIHTIRHSHRHQDAQQSVAVTKRFVFTVFVEAEGKISGEKSPAIDGRRGLFFRDKDGEHPEVYLFTHPKTRSSNICFPGSEQGSVWQIQRGHVLN